MLRELKIVLFAAVLILPATAFAGVVTITGFTPVGNLDGSVDGDADFQITSITAGATVSTPLLQGAVAAEVTGGINGNAANGHSGTSAVDALIGLDAGTGALGLGGGSGRAVAAWFDQPVAGDGDTATPEIFVVDWGAGIDNYQVQLLTSDAAAGIGGAATAATVQVLSSDQVQTGTTVFFSLTQPLAGVGIDLDSEVDSGTQILGILIPSADGLGGLSGVDPAIIATVVPEPSAMVLLALGSVGLAMSRRRSC